MIPATQRNPSPYTAGDASVVVPCSTIESAAGSSPDEISTTVSGVVVPVAWSHAPMLPGCDVAQPRPATPKLPHGHAPATRPSPEQYGVPGPQAWLEGSVGSEPPSVSSRSRQPSRSRSMPMRVDVPRGTTV